jgi:hypothetical protein
VTPDLPKFTDAERDHITDWMDKWCEKASTVQRLWMRRAFCEGIRHERERQESERDDAKNASIDDNLNV